MMFCSGLILVALSSWLSPSFAFPLAQRQAAGKAGLAADQVNDALADQFKGGKVSWYYSWQPHGATKNLELVPMLWGKNQEDDWKKSIDGIITDNKVTAVLGMNEPDKDGQAKMNASDARTLWNDNIAGLKAKNIKVGAPAVSSGDTGKPWMTDFMSGMDPDAVDFIPIHYYGTDEKAFETYANDMHTTFKKPLWVTELACQDFGGGPQCSKDQISSFMTAAQTFMDGASFIERYSWFGAMANLHDVNPDNALADAKGNITPLGKQYNGSK